MKRLTQLILFVLLCFAFNASAQITKIDTYSNKVKGLSTAQKEDLEMLFFGTVSKIFLTDDGKSQMLWAEKGSAKMVELTYKQIEQLKNKSLSNTYKTVEVISLTIEKGVAFKLDDGYLSAFPNLKYLLINSREEVSTEDIKSLLGNLLSSSSVPAHIEVIVNKTNTSS